MRKFCLIIAILAFGIVAVTTGAEAVTLDLSATGSSGTITGNTALFSRTDLSGQGTGNFDSFLRVHLTGQGDAVTPTIEDGYNTDGTVEFDTMADPHTHSIEISDIPTVLIGDTYYKEFALDAAEPGGGGSTLFVDNVKIYLLNAPNITGYSTWSAANTPKYVLDVPGDNSIKLDNITGNGIADLFLYVPVTNFTGTNTWVYFYTQMSSAGGSFEEWGVRVGIVTPPCEGPSCDPVATPEPASMLLFGTGLVGAIFRKKMLS